MLRCKVVKVKGVELVLRVWIIDWQRQVFYEEANFALQLLLDAVQGKRTATPLGREVSAAQAVDRRWLLDNAERFIAACDLDDMANFPVDPAVQSLPEKEYNTFWNTLSGLPRADYTIEVTDPGWLAHLKRGQTFDSSAFDCLIE